MLACPREDDLLAAEEESYAYFADRADLPGVALFTSQRADASEFDLALIRRVPCSRGDAILQAIVRHYEDNDRAPRVRLTPWSAPADWPSRLQRAGLAETDGRHLSMILPRTVRISADPLVDVRRAVTREDADLYSAIQATGFDLPMNHRAWDRELARRHLAAGQRRFYLATVAGSTIGAASSQDFPGRITGIYGVTTAPDGRRRGVATGLLSRMVEDARAAGGLYIYLTAVPGSAGHFLYARLGFVPLFEARTFAR